MAIIFERDFGRVWSDGVSPYVFSATLRIPEQQEFEELAKTTFRLIKTMSGQFGSIYTVMDFRLCLALPDYMTEKFVVDHLSHQSRLGVRHHAFITPYNARFDSVLTLAALRCNSGPITIHYTFEDALRKINESRSSLAKRSRKRWWTDLFQRD